MPWTPQAGNVGEPSWLLFTTPASVKLAESFSESPKEGSVSLLPRLLCSSSDKWLAPLPATNLAHSHSADGVRTIREGEKVHWSHELAAAVVFS